MKRSPFNIEKLYLDCIDNDGNCFIVYWAKLEFAFLKLCYSGLIFSDTHNKNIQKSSFKKMLRPAVSDKLLFENEALNISGQWQKTDAPISILLYTDAAGRKVYWHCHHPKTSTRIAYKNQKFEGLGYAETLSLPIKPWQLPIETLRWGRFLSNNYTVIWIHWKGAHPVNKIFCNGRLYEDAVFEADAIYFDEGRMSLHFQEKIIVREGKLSHVLAKMPWLKLIFNRRILHTVEIKYKAKTRISSGSETLEEGWSLFETVTWTQ